jgi:hypothetical protein
VHTHSIVFHVSKEMREEFHRVHIGPDFVSSAPSVKTTKCVSVQVLSVAPKNKKMLTRIKK